MEGTTITSNAQNNPTKSWNLRGLRDEVERVEQKVVKKLMKLNQKLDEADVSLESKTDDSEENSVNKVETLTLERTELQIKLEKLRLVGETLKVIKNTRDEQFQIILPDILSLNLTGNPPTPKAIKQFPQVSKSTKSEAAPRKPYFTYLSTDGIEIRVGRRAEDNDELSTNPTLRDDNDWWLHVAGYAGSHVVIRNTDDNVPSMFRETVKDAAVLAIINSKAKNIGGKVTVSLTRCRNVSKPRGVNAGLVHLSGDIRTVNIDMKIERNRLEKLQKVEEENS
jgi:predicted ribosome quality control (RQC) complex YloA/Tae2 family protein